MRRTVRGTCAMREKREPDGHMSGSRTSLRAWLTSSRFVAVCAKGLPTPRPAASIRRPSSYAARARAKRGRGSDRSRRRRAAGAASRSTTTSTGSRRGLRSRRPLPSPRKSAKLLVRGKSTMASIRSRLICGTDRPKLAGAWRVLGRRVAGGTARGMRWRKSAWAWGSRSRAPGS